MPIKRVLREGEPLIIYRIAVDPATYPNLFAALDSRGMGNKRTDFIRDTLEAFLAGEGGQSAAPLAAPVAASEVAPAQTPKVEVVSATEARREPPSILFRQDF